MPADDNELDEPRIEYALLAFMLDHAQDEPSTMPVLGELILRRLKISMKVSLTLSFSYTKNDTLRWNISLTINTFYSCIYRVVCAPF